MTLEHLNKRNKAYIETRDEIIKYLLAYGAIDVEWACNTADDFY